MKTLFQTFTEMETGGECYGARVSGSVYQNGNGTFTAEASGPTGERVATENSYPSPEEAQAAVFNLAVYGFES